MMDDFLQFLREPIAQRSLLACVMIGFANGFVSGLVILKKSALQIGTLSCALLPGIAVAVLLFGLTRWSLLTGAVVAVAWLVSGGQSFAIRSAAYGALAAWLPAVLFARLVARRMRQQANAASALLALMVGEGIKIALTVALLLAAPRLLAQVHWLALLAGFVVTIKAAWVALWWSSTHRPASAGGA